MDKFKLSDAFVEKYVNIKPQWGFGELGYFVFKRTYARPIYNSNGDVERTEEWWETVRRVVEGCYTYQKRHCKDLNIPFNYAKAQRSAQVMFDKIFNFKFTPPGRGLWMAGTDFVDQHGSMALNNCFSYDTKIITANGVFNIGALRETRQRVLTDVGFVDAVIKGFGEQPVIDVQIATADNKDVIRCTSDHKFYIYSIVNNIIIGCCEKAACCLSPGDYLVSADWRNNVGVSIHQIDPWRVQSLTDPLPSEPVYCAEVPDHNRFTLANGIMVHNCGFVSTDRIDINNTGPFEWAINALFLGVGVGADVRGAGKITIKKPAEVNSWTKERPVLVIKDSREGWIEALRWKLKAYFDGKPMPEYDYSQIRPAGALIRSFGGVASGPAPLEDMLNNIDGVLQPLIGQKLTAGAIVDIFNLIARCVVSGNVRRSSEIMLGEIDDQEFMSLKDPEINQDALYHHRWASNNSVFAYVGKTDYNKVAELIVKNGEPGLVYIENARNYSRMRNGPDYSDKAVMGVNPCVVGETLIAVADGRGAVPIQQLAEEGKDIPVYSVNRENGEIEIKWGRFPRKTRENVEVIKLTLDDGSSITVTPDHTMLTRELQEVRAKDLKPGDSLCAFNQTPEAPIKPTNNEYCAPQSNTNSQDNWHNSYASSSFKELQELADKHSHQIASVEKINKREDVYNLTVDDNHNYAVISSGKREKKLASGLFIGNCGEICIPDHGLCCLVEVFPARHENVNEFLETLKYAYLFAKSITLVNTADLQTNATILRDRRIGVSLSGIVDAFAKYGRREFLEKWCEAGYAKMKQWDETYSDWLCIPKSRKISTVKPSGTTSLLVGCSPGIHYPHSQYYIRRVRIADNSDMLPAIVAAGYKTEPDKYTPNTTVVEFPVKIDHFDRCKKDVTIWEQMCNLADMQKYWSDNAVSITVTFNEDEANDIPRVLQTFEDKIKSVSFMKNDSMAYEQMPYEEISEADYLTMIEKIKPIDFNSNRQAGIGEHFCDGDKCSL